MLLGRRRRRAGPSGALPSPALPCRRPSASSFTRMQLVGGTTYITGQSAKRIIIRIVLSGRCRSTCSLINLAEQCISADKQQQATVLNGDRDGGDDPPPMNFNYDDYRAAASRRNENAEALLKHGGGNAAACSSPPTVTAFFLEDGATGAGLDHTVRAALEGSSFVVTYVCHATTSGPERATTAAGSDDSPVSP
jgi:hypothetical protein